MSVENIQQGKYIVFRDTDNVVKVKNVKTGGIELPTLNDTSGIAYAITNDTSGEGVYIAGNFSGGARLITPNVVVSSGLVVPLNIPTSPASGSIFASPLSGLNTLGLYNGTEFVPVGRAPTTKVIVRNEGAACVARWDDGRILYSGTAPESGLQAAFNQSGSVYVADGVYILGNTFPGLTIGNISGANDRQKKITFASEAELRVPQNNWSGTVITFLDGCNNCDVAGGYISEGGASPTFLWTAFKLQSSTQDGNQDNTIRDTVIKNVGTGIELRVFSGSGNNGYVSSNTFENIRITRPQYGIVFNQEAALGTVTAMNRNHFDRVVAEFGHSSGVSGGVIGVLGRSNVFLDCVMYDIPQSGQSECVIASGSTDTLIIQGIMTMNEFLDYGDNTRVIDGWQGYRDLQVLPSQKKIGFINPGSTVPVGEGIWNNIVASSGHNRTMDGSGIYQKFITFASGAQAGMRLNAAWTRRGLNPMSRTEFRLDQDVSGVLILIGFTSTTGAFNSGYTALDNIEGVYLTTDGSGANFKVMYNNGAAASTIIDTGVPVVSGQWNNFDIQIETSRSLATNRIWKWKLNKDKWNYVSGNYPAFGTNLSNQWLIQTIPGVSGSLSIRYAQGQTDR